MVNDTYRPDCYTRLPDPTIIEFQRSTISHKRMQVKVDAFLDSYIKKEHDAKTLWIFTDTKYNITLPPGFTLIQSALYEKRGVS
jgi:competence CoiA-like predicted nuclease